VIVPILNRLAQLRRDERGAYLMELALVLPAFLMLVMGTFDIGMQLYIKATLNGIVEQAGRGSTLEANAASQTALDDQVTSEMGTVAHFGTLSFERRSYQDFSNVSQPEDFTDSNHNGIRDAGECFQDANNNGRWDADRARSGQGGANDVVVYSVNFDFDRIFPLWRLLGQPQAKRLTATTVLRNQPYTNQTNSTVVVCT